MRCLLTICVLAVGLICRVNPAYGESVAPGAFNQYRELLASISFEERSSLLTAVAVDELAAVLPRIRETAGAERMIRIEGFSGHEGFVEDRFRLSLHRANTVAAFLEKNGVPCSVGFGDTDGLSTGPGSVGIAPRVEIASYPQLFLIEFAGTHRIDIDEVKLHD